MYGIHYIMYIIVFQDQDLGNGSGGKLETSSPATRKKVG
jgi:hypothetical protein